MTHRFDMGSIDAIYADLAKHFKEQSQSRNTHPITVQGEVKEESTLGKILDHFATDAIIEE